MSAYTHFLSLLGTPETPFSEQPPENTVTLLLFPDRIRSVRGRAAGIARAPRRTYLASVLQIDPPIGRPCPRGRRDSSGLRRSFRIRRRESGILRAFRAPARTLTPADRTAEARASSTAT